MSGKLLRNYDFSFICLVGGIQCSANGVHRHLPADNTALDIPVYDGPGKISQTAWTPDELLDAKIRKRLLHTTTPGLSGTIQTIRENDVVLKLQFPGLAFVKITDLKSQPPARYQSGVRVVTPFGKGVVKALRCRTQDGIIDNEVELVENVMTGNKAAVAYMNPYDLRLRTDNTALETMEDATQLRNQGNERFKAKDFIGAQQLYAASVEMLSTYKGKQLDDSTRKLFLDCFLKSLGNTAQSFLRQDPPDLMQAAIYTTEALNLDPTDITGNRAKNLYRRGEVFFRQRDYESAITDLTDVLLQNNSDAQSLLKTARELRDKETAKSKKRWAAAFAKAAEEESDEPNGNSVRFASPAAADTKEYVPVTPADATPDKQNGERRRLFAGATPFPKAGNSLHTSEVDDASSSSATMLMEEELVETKSSWAPWLLGAAALGLAGGAAYLLMKGRANR